MWYHIRCGKQISFDGVSEGYHAQCPKCDEDLFEFETDYTTIPEGIQYGTRG
jgi:hypothetical protein